jgi:hypothetical protein
VSPHWTLNIAHLVMVTIFSLTDCGATHIEEAEVRAELKRRVPGRTHEVDALEFYFFKEYVF